MQTALKKNLTQEEFSLVTNANFIISKTNIIQSVYEMFGELSDEYRAHLSSLCKEKINVGTPKISRGENYNGLPYVMLDYPRNFSKEGTFAIRTFFWWGNFFSITLHLSGNHLMQWKNVLLKSIQKGEFSGWFINGTNDEWEHHFEGNNYRLIDNTMQMEKEDFTCLKLAKKIPLEKWEESYDFLLKNFKTIVQILHK